MKDISHVKWREIWENGILGKIGPPFNYFGNHHAVIDNWFN